MILAGDIGGTNARIALFEVASGHLRRLALERYPSREHSGLAPIIETFLAAHGAEPRHACFGIAGPVRDGRCEAMNLPWCVDGEDLERRFGWQDSWLVNDLEANAWGLEALERKDLATLQEGDAAASGNRAVISAGTGLGEAGIYSEDGKFLPFATEGGHADFAPQNEEQIELLRFLLRRREHVSWEFVISGTGLVNIYEFLRAASGATGPPEFPPEVTVAGDVAATITQSALAGKCPLCVRALERFVFLYGAEAGNLALKVMATGGVYLGGGIAPKILPALEGGAFIDGFRSKGRLAPLLAEIPVHVILNSDTALLGAAMLAARRSGLLARVHAGR